MSRFHRSVLWIACAAALTSCGGLPYAVREPAPIATATKLAATARPAATTADATATIEDRTAAQVATPAATRAPTPSATAAITESDEQIKQAVQKAVNLWIRGFNEANADLLRRSIDPQRPALRRTQERLMKYLTGAQGHDGMSWSGKVIDVQRRDGGYVQANVKIGGAYRPFTFRRVGSAWLLSEPSRAELGKPQKLETAHFVVEYYAWDKAVVKEVASLMEQARDEVVKKLGRAPDKRSTVRLIPTAEVTPGAASGQELASYRRNIKDMLINSPGSFGFGFYDPSAGWQKDLRGTLAHEYVHLLNDCCFTPMAKMQDWMIEGIAVYSSEGGHTNGYMPSVIYAVQHDSLIPIRDTKSPPMEKQDLEHLTVLKQDTALAYGESASLVEYIVTHYGGLDGWWRLVDNYATTQDFDLSLKQVTGVTLEQFEKGWRDELKRRYGGS